MLEVEKACERFLTKLGEEVVFRYLQELPGKWKGNADVAFGFVRAWTDVAKCHVSQEISKEITESQKLNLPMSLELCFQKCKVALWGPSLINAEILMTMKDFVMDLIVRDIGKCDPSPTLFEINPGCGLQGFCFAEALSWKRIMYDTQTPVDDIHVKIRGILPYNNTYGPMLSHTDYSGKIQLDLFGNKGDVLFMNYPTEESWSRFKGTVLVYVGEGPESLCPGKTFFERMYKQWLTVHSMELGPCSVSPRSVCLIMRRRRISDPKSVIVINQREAEENWQYFLSFIMTETYGTCELAQHEIGL